MKKAKKDAPRQRRRQSALDRFKVDRTRKDDKEYMGRKDRELTSLKSSLGIRIVKPSAIAKLCRPARQAPPCLHGASGVGKSDWSAALPTT